MPDQQFDPDQILRRARQGDTEAVEQLLGHHRSRLARMVNARMDPRLKARVDPSDVVQDTLAAASRRLPRYLEEQPIPFYPWLRQIAWEQLVRLQERHLVAACRSVGRERRAAVGVSDESVVMLAERLVGTGTSPTGCAVRRELCGRVQEAMDRLSADDRELLIQRHVEQLSSKEIAALPGISEAAVNMRHMRAVGRMRTTLSEANWET
jgi:RNA polymerase sigma-70 factor (ECF subfamily)